MNTKPTVIDAYIARAAAIHIKLARLQKLADDHFGHDPEAIHPSSPQRKTCYCVPLPVVPMGA